MSTEAPIYLGTVLLENNRWGKGDRQPSFRVSDWTQRIADDGFDGLELWENHALLADGEELNRLRTGPSPVKIFNSYDVCEPETLADRRRIADLCELLGAEGMKFNLGKNQDLRGVYIKNLREWRGMFPESFRFLCECHRGSGMEDPEVASGTFAKLPWPGFGAILHGIDNDEETVRGRFAAYGERITHLHCFLSKQGLMGEDVVRRRLDLLRELGFHGTFTIEFTEGVRDELSMEELYRNAVRDLKLLRRCLG